MEQVRRRTCVHCGQEFEYSVGRGRDRLLCSVACRRAGRKMHNAERLQGLRCAAAGCELQPRHPGSALCEKHYGRMRRNGNLADPSRKGFYEHSHGYIVALGTDGHPLSTPSQMSRLYEHRAVFYAAHGDGPFSCHWCGTKVSWATLNVDHLDEDKANNSIENLVPSCWPCNVRRGQPKQRMKARGRSTLLTAFGRTQTRAEWARELGIKSNNVAARLRSGWSIERALSEPRGKCGPKAAQRMPVHL